MTKTDHPRRHRYGVEAADGGGWFLIYDALVAVGGFALKCVAPFHRKLRAALEGRRGGVNSWKTSPFDDRPSILIHVASRGEYEAVCPLLDRLAESGSHRLALSFSSPSVEKPVMKRDDLWAAGYLPLDYFGEQIRLLTRLEPSLILISKHDFWPNMIRAAASLSIPVILINANFHSGTKRTLPVARSFNRSFMKRLEAVWTVSEEDARRVRPLLSTETDLSPLGDSRYDQGLIRAAGGRDQFAGLKESLGAGPVVVAGSTWPPEEKLIWPSFAALRKRAPGAKLVIAPHELGDEAFERNRREAGERGLSLGKYSDWQGGVVGEDVLYIDKMGLLAGLYAVGWAAVVGGGFGAGVHSVLEPAAHGLPVSFGPRRQVSNEASLLLAEGGGFLLGDAAGLEALWLGWIANPESYKQAAAAAHRVVLSRAGAVERLIERLQPYLVGR